MSWFFYVTTQLTYVISKTQRFHDAVISDKLFIEKNVLSFAFFHGLYVEFSSTFYISVSDKNSKSDVAQLISSRDHIDVSMKCFVEWC